MENKVSDPVSDQMCCGLKAWDREIMSTLGGVHISRVFTMRGFTVIYTVTLMKYLSRTGAVV